MKNRFYIRGHVGVPVRPLTSRSLMALQVVTPRCRRPACPPPSGNEKAMMKDVRGVAGGRMGHVEGGPECVDTE